ncbi:MAG: hypothetical protein RLY20_1649 [Verrucomicrobiota bacterium]|jgi:ABC-type transport system involved in multi-copper enzyme maturation permease subunit
MNVLPVVTRELRAEARHAFTYWIRVAGAGIGTLAAASFAFTNGLRPDQGEMLFSALHFKLQLAIWTLVPLLTADCLSRERREGTLGLLFLTPLKALDVVVAKSLAHGLRATTLVLAVLPVIALPLLMGGVSWHQGASAILLDLSGVSLALAAGIVASSFSTSWVRSLIVTACLTLIFLIGFTNTLGFVFTLSTHGFRFAIDEGESFKVGLNLLGNISPYYSYQYLMAGAPVPGGSLGIKLVATTSTTFTLSLAVLFLSGLTAALVTKRNWQQRPPNPLLEWLRVKFTRPVIARDVLRGWMRHSLERNPIGWLERRTWSGRTVIWGWFAVMISVYSLILTDARYLTHNFSGIHLFMGWTLLASMAMNASMSFRRERETRVLELLLVSPLKENQIIHGRVRGLWGQFLPSIGLLLAGWTYLCTALNKFPDNVGAMFTMLVAFLAVPIIGLYFSLVCRNFLTALVWTILVGLMLPTFPQGMFHLIAIIFRGAVIIDFGWLDYLFHPVVFQTSLAALLLWRLRHRLVHRRFATETN